MQVSEHGDCLCVVVWECCFLHKIIAQYVATNRVSDFSQTVSAVSRCRDTQLKCRVRRERLHILFR